MMIGLATELRCVHKGPMSATELSKKKETTAYRKISSTARDKNNFDGTRRVRETKDLVQS